MAAPSDFRYNPWKDDMAALEAIRAKAAELDQYSDGRDVCGDPRCDLVLDERDVAQEWADKLAHAIAAATGVDIGLYTDTNDPWTNALTAIEAGNTTMAAITPSPGQ